VAFFYILAMALKKKQRQFYDWVAPTFVGQRPFVCLYQYSLLIIFNMVVFFVLFFTGGHMLS